MPEIEEFGSEEEQPAFEIEKQKETVNPYDVFRLAKGILISSVILYVVFATLRIFTPDCNKDGAKEVWEYSKVILNSIVSLVLGLYFGTKQDSKKDNQ